MKDQKKETKEERDARMGGDNEIEGSRSAARIQGQLRYMDQQGRKMTRQARQPKR